MIISLKTVPTEGMAVKFIVETVLLLKVDHFGRLLNRYKIDRMVNDSSSSCNLK